MLQLRAKIVSNRRLGKDCGHCVINAPKIAQTALPGQFINVRVSAKDAPFLRRPFSVHRVSGRNLEILYQVLGEGTQILSRKKRGEYLDIIGPLGNGFELSRPEWKAVIVAGGMGVAPLTFLAERLVEVKSQKSKIKNIAFIGASSKNKILCEKEFKNSGCSVKIATDDGSRGFRGRVTSLLDSFLSTIDYQLSTIYACGPRPMLKEVARIAQERGIPAQLSLEEHMACGFGACLGCVVKVKSQKAKGKNEFEYKRACKDGPVFNAQELIF